MSFDKYYFGNTIFSAPFKAPFLPGMDFVMPKESKPKPWTPPAQVTQYESLFSSREKVTRLGSLDFSLFKASTRREV